MSNRFFITLLAILAVVFGVFFFTKHKSTSKTPASSSSTTAVSNHVIGEGKSGVVFTEYGDFQCPACYQYEPIMRQIRDKYKDTIYFKFRNFPLVQIHQNALIAARAAEAASLQGKFWEMHDMLYDQQKAGWAESSNPTSYFKDFATQLGLNVDKFLSDLQSSQTNDTVQADIADGQSFGFDGTPSFTLNGQKIDRQQTADAFYKLIDDAIAAKQKSGQ